MDTQELAGCVVYNEHGELLVLHRNTPELVQWELPGGKLEAGEPAMAAVVREAHEELLVDIDIVKKLGQAEFISNETIKNYTWFEARVRRGVPAIGEPEKFDELRYWNINELTKRDDISPNLVNLLKVIA